MHAASVIEYEKSYTNLAGFFFDGFTKLLKPALVVLVFIQLFLLVSSTTSKSSMILGRRRASMFSN